MTVTHVSASAFNVSIYTRTYFCYYFSWIANICCRLLRWRQKPQCSKPRYCCATREVRRRTDGTVRPAPTLPISANSCFNRYGRFSLVDLNTIRARKTDGTVENTIKRAINFSWEGWLVADFFCNCVQRTMCDCPPKRSFLQPRATHSKVIKASFI